MFEFYVWVIKERFLSMKSCNFHVSKKKLMQPESLCIFQVILAVIFYWHKKKITIISCQLVDYSNFEFFLLLSIQLSTFFFFVLTSCCISITPACNNKLFSLDDRPIDKIRNYAWKYVYQNSTQNKVDLFAKSNLNPANILRLLKYNWGWK